LIIIRIYQCIATEEAVEAEEVAVEAKEAAVEAKEAECLKEEKSKFQRHFAIY
jgi:hypothetical protein